MVGQTMMNEHNCLTRGQGLGESGNGARTGTVGLGSTESRGNVQRARGSGPEVQVLTSRTGWDVPRQKRQKLLPGTV